MSGYHLKKIKKGEFGKWSKVLEEFSEIEDAQEQNNRIMELVEISDMYGALEEYVKNSFNMTMTDIKIMSDVTKKVFTEGYRVSKPNLFQYLRDNHDHILSWGLGFIQVKVKNVNFNFYVINPYFNIDNPHSHKYNFSSTILRGELRESVFLYNTTNDHYKITHNKCSSSKSSENVGINSEPTIYTWKEGDTYTRAADEMHTIKAIHNTVTKVTKSESFNEPRSIHLTAEFDEEHQYTDDELWKLIKPLAESIYDY